MLSEYSGLIQKYPLYVKAAYSVTMNIFEFFYFLFKSFEKVELNYVFTIKMFSTAENMHGKVNYLIK